MDFVNDSESFQFCLQILDFMIRVHGVDSKNATRYLQQHWNGQPFMGNDDTRYHRLPEEWAEHILAHRQYLFG
jgi:hypothetical protein